MDMDMEYRTLKIMRLMAWERAKGELNSMLQTYYDDTKYNEMSEAVKVFIKEVEDNAKQE